jgi:hypothetical protein
MSIITIDFQMDRFWSKVNISDDPDECWEWTRAKDSSGYGSFWFDGSAVMASRMALRLSTGDNPLDKYACHTCDNPPCCNPNHLFWGDPEENVKDMVEKGRARWQQDYGDF